MFKKIIFNIMCIISIHFSSLSAFVQNKEANATVFQTQLQKKTYEQQALNTQLLKVAEECCVFDFLKWYFPKKDALKSLLDQKASIDATDANGETALCKAIYCAGKNNQPADAAIKLLIDSRSSLYGSLRNGSFPLKHAFTFKMYSVIEMLVQAGAKRCSPFGTPLHALINAKEITDEEACRMFDIFKRYRLNNIDIDTLSSTEHTAVCVGMMDGRLNPKMMDQLFLHGATPWCPAPDCKNKPLQQRFNQDALAAHEQWKGGATREMMRHIRIRPLSDMVMGYVFGRLKNS